MIREVRREGERVWLDVTAPTREELASLAKDYGLHPTQVADCLQPEHLPKYERTGDTTFVIVRAVDEGAPADADTAQALTHKVALFLGKNFLISIHRCELPFLTALRERYANPQQAIYLQVVLIETLQSAVETFQGPLDEAELRINAFEAAVLRDHRDVASWEGVFRAQTRLTLIKRLLWHTLNAAQKFVPYSSVNQPLCQDLRERVETFEFFADNLLDDLRNLLAIQLSLAAKTTNDVMRVLTVFSAFFMPLTFLVGVYGMNFRSMPELDWQWGYLAVWLCMIALSIGLWRWFRGKRWL
ncbi:MAG: hypothetical protein HY905_23765 [Deltaproteobacteria bacterium]|nr:hypothetical protein [Deltaproteobacteria bacterium]